jgi:hypothetical protein
MASSTPTPAQLAAANLIAVLNPTTNGKPDRSYDSVNKNFPPITVIYVTPPYTFTATQSGTSQVQVNWNGFSPTELARNGVDSSGYGPWNTGPLTNEPTSGSFLFTYLVSGDTYIFTATISGGTTLTSTLTMSGSTPTTITISGSDGDLKASPLNNTRI